MFRSMKPAIFVLFVACAAEETALPPLVAVPDEVSQPLPERKANEPPPMAERAVKRCEEVKRLRTEGGELITQKRWEEAKKNFLRAIELDPADKESPGQLEVIDKATNNQAGSSTAIEYAQAIGAARSPCEPPAKTV